MSPFYPEWKLRSHFSGLVFQQQIEYFTVKMSSVSQRVKQLNIQFVFLVWLQSKQDSLGLEI